MCNHFAYLMQCEQQNRKLNKTTPCCCLYIIKTAIGDFCNTIFLLYLAVQSVMRSDHQGEATGGARREDLQIGPQPQYAMATDFAGAENKCKILTANLTSILKITSKITAIVVQFVLVFVLLVYICQK